jgi:hypothetical protein
MRDAGRDVAIVVSLHGQRRSNCSPYHIPPDH